jgi:hypothetical protein
MMPPTLTIAAQPTRGWRPEIKVMKEHRQSIACSNGSRRPKLPEMLRGPDQGHQFDLFLWCVNRSYDNFLRKNASCRITDLTIEGLLCPTTFGSSGAHEVADIERSIRFTRPFFE